MAATREAYDVLVIGGGPAGMAAAASAAAAGLSVAIVDERITLGGQIYKRMGPGFRVSDPKALGREYERGQRLIDSVAAAGVRTMTSTSVVSIDPPEAVLVLDGASARPVQARALVLAPGARDRALAFPGWTLPGVLTAGGAQTLVKTQRVLPGRRLVFAGSGPLALAFPAQLHRLGAGVETVLEAGPAPGVRDVAGIALAAAGNRDLLADAIRYRLQLLRARVPLRYRRIVVAAEGEGRVESVVHAAADSQWRPISGTEERVAADVLCLGYGFTPSTELLRLAGCALAHDEQRGGVVTVVDDWMRTSVPGVFAAGDGTGVEGVHVAVDEGRLAALGAALQLGALSPSDAAAQASEIRRRLARRRAFRRALSHMHRVGPGIYGLARSDTIVCRCEAVTRAQLDAAIETSSDIGVVKGLTRAGMGLCQARNCEGQVRAMIAARHGRGIDEVGLATARAPVRPVPLGAIADDRVEDRGLFVGGES